MLMFIEAPVVDAILKGFLGIMGTCSALMLFMLVLHATVTWRNK